MEKFTKIKSVPAYIPLMNIDTDKIIPKQFLKTIKRSGLGKSLFYEMRFDEKGNPIKGFILDQEPFNSSKILITGKNFGCGSSREHAPWAIRDFGFKVLIAPSFADIFFNNSIKNGLLLIALDEDLVDKLFQLATLDDPLIVTVNLDRQTIGTNAHINYDFSIEPSIKQCLIDGSDDISLTLQYKDEILRYEQDSQKKNPWRFS